MPRDIPVGNGRMLVNFDQHYQIRDLYFPHVGQENHGSAQPCRFGIYTSIPRTKAAGAHTSPNENLFIAGRSGQRPFETAGTGPHTPPAAAPSTTGTKAGKLAWTTDGFEIRRRYLKETLTTSVSLEHAELQVALYCNDAVDFHRRVMVRKIKVCNLANDARTVQLVHHHAWQLTGTNVGDTAYYDPDLKSVVHYKGKRYILATFFDEAGVQRVDEFATGTSGFGGHEGTWRDAEDGHLQGNAIAQGAVDSTMSHHVHLDAGSDSTCHMVIIAAESREELLELHAWLLAQTPQAVLDRTTAYWRLWVSGTQINFADLPPKYVDLFKRSLLTVRTQVDDTGAILAANDSDIMQFARDTYSYVWPRDGALVADSLDAAGFPMLSRKFFEFCQRTITRGPEGGYFHHKYNPDGSVASSWHPWQTTDGKRRLPIQEDETALVVWALWRHFERHRDTEFIRPMWVDVVMPAADFMCRFRDERTGLPQPSYDLWEERWGVHAFTVATVWAALRAARNFALCFGDQERAKRYADAADEIRAGAERHLYDSELGRFVRRLVPKDDATDAADATIYDTDTILDASMWALGHFGIFAPEDPRLRATMTALEKRLWIKTPVGGMARYENDYYHRVSNDIAAVAGNPWFITTLWLADDLILRATNAAELKRAMPILDWVAAHASESGVLAEQVHPHTNEPLSVSPLTWSHAQVVSTAISYLNKLQTLSNCTTCRQPLFHVRTPADPDLFEQTLTSPAAPHLETLVPAARIAGMAGGGGGTLSIHIPDCIGCGVCIAACAGNVLVSHNGKALVDVRHTASCDLDGACLTACPTNCIKIRRESSVAA